MARTVRTLSLQEALAILNQAGVPIRLEIEPGVYFRDYFFSTFTDPNEPGLIRTVHVSQDVPGEIVASAGSVSVVILDEKGSHLVSATSGQSLAELLRELSSDGSDGIDLAEFIYSASVEEGKDKGQPVVYYSITIWHPPGHMTFPQWVGMPPQPPFPSGDMTF